MLRHCANLKEIQDNDTCLNYYNLHGSVYLEWEFTNKNYSLSYEFTQWKDFLPDNFLPYFIPLNDKKYLLNSNIVTGLNKKERTILEPIKSFIDIFKRDCMEANTIIVIGYSYSDHHINSIIGQSDIKNKNFICIDNKGTANEQDFLNRFIIPLNKLDLDNHNSINENNGWITFPGTGFSIFTKGLSSFLNCKEWKNQVFSNIYQ